MSTYKCFDIVVVPFPFSDSEIEITKNRPALIISSEIHGHSHSVLAMITSARRSSWALDIPITNLESCGLKNESLIRFKFFTLDHRLIRGTIGKLAKADQLKFIKNFKLAFHSLLK